jgi:hypothetical protein
VLSRILPLFAFSNKLTVSNLDKLVGEFSSRNENAFVRKVEGTLLPLTSSIHRSAWLLGRRLTIA